MDTQEEAALSGHSSQDQSSLPAVPMSLQDRQALLARAPPDLAPALKAAADSVSNTADAQVPCMLSVQWQCCVDVVGKAVLAFCGEMLLKEWEKTH